MCTQVGRLYQNVSPEIFIYGKHLYPYVYEMFITKGEKVGVIPGSAVVKNKKLILYEFFQMILKGYCVEARFRTGEEEGQVGDIRSRQGMVL